MSSSYKYNRTYGRRAAPASQASIQFDKLLENSKKPTAAKSAGTLGKWGMTTFTSTRNADSK